MKRIISIILALAMVFALASCGKTAEKKMSREEAEQQILTAMQYYLEQAYGDKVVDARIYVEKVYMAEDEKNDELVKTLKLGEDEYAFQVRYELLPAEGVDVNEFMAGTGMLDESSGWIVEKYNVGVLRPNQGGEPAYVITDFGTGF